MRILIVDDDFLSRRILIKCMSNLGECDVATNGREAMVAYEAALKEGRPYDFILLDIIMPEMDGKEMLRLVRTRESGNGNNKPARTKIAMATTLGDKESVINAFREQCDGYIVKPYSSESVLQDLRRAGILGNR